MVVGLIKPDDLAAVDVDGHVIDYGAAAVAFDQPVGLERDLPSLRRRRLGKLRLSQWFDFRHHYLAPKVAAASRNLPRFGFRLKKPKRNFTGFYVAARGRLQTGRALVRIYSMVFTGRVFLNDPP
jgi:hypothetical protein